MMWLKACPRCKTGDLYLDGDNSRHCMQCGHIQHSVDQIAIAYDLARVLRRDGLEELPAFAV